MVSNSSHIIRNPFRNGRVFCLYLFAALMLMGSMAQAQSKLRFTDTKKNFGFVKRGELVKMDFSFKNEGTTPLIITECKVECSCTTIEFPKAPIAPGQTGIIQVSFDTKTVYDRQDRTVEIFSNAPGSPHKIRFKGVVLKP